MGCTEPPNLGRQPDVAAGTQEPARLGGARNESHSTYFAHIKEDLHADALP